MAAEEKQDTLDSWLNKATDPRNMSDRWDCIKGFYEEVNKVQDGVQIATRLLAHKIQSPQEKEALQALTVLEACMNNCGTQFHKEAGKFRFLNELIKVVSPKHLGLGSTEKVKSKVIECLYSWSQWLKDEDKIQEAYQMLKKKGIVKQDPKLPREFVMPPPSPRAAGSIFDDEDKSKLLGQLLKSRNPEDLQAANLLIKDVIKEEQDRMEKVRRRTSVLEEVEGTTERLRELQEKFKKTVLSPEEKQEMKSLYERCEKMRPTLFRLASDTTDNDAALGEILQANDKLILALNLYQETVERKVGDGTDLHHSGNKAPESRKETKTYHLIDFSALEFGQGEPISLSKPACSSSPLSLLEEELISLGLNEQPVEMTSLGSCSSQSHHEKLAWTRRDEDNDCGLRRAVWRDAGRSVLVARGSAVDGDAGPKEDPSLDPSQQSRRVLQTMSLWNDVLSKSSSPDTSLSNVFVPLESIQPSSIAPVVVYDRKGVRVMLHRARDPPDGRQDIVVMVISMLSTSPLPVKDIVFQAAVPKNMTVKLQSASGSELPAYNPLRPPATISQVLLLSNPLRAKVRLRYKLTFTQGESKTSDVGEVGFQGGP